MWFDSHIPWLSRSLPPSLSHTHAHEIIQNWHIYLPIITVLISYALRLTLSSSPVSRYEPVACNAVEISSKSSLTIITIAGLSSNKWWEITPRHIATDYQTGGYMYTRGRALSRSSLLISTFLAIILNSWRGFGSMWNWSGVQRWYSLNISTVCPGPGSSVCSFLSGFLLLMWKICGKGKENMISY